MRNVDTVQDYTNYARGLYADYYQCHGADHGLPAACFSPSTTWNETERNTHQSHELRLSTPDEWRLRGIAGIFWEDLRIYDQLNWLYKTLPACTSTEPYGCLTDVGPAPGSSISDPTPIRNDSTAYFNDVKRRLPAARVLYLLGLRPHSQGADRDRWNAVLPLRQL